MVALDVNTIFELAAKISFGAVLTFASLLALRRFCSSKGILLSFASLKTLKLILMVGVCAVLSFILLVCTVTMSARREIWSVFGSVQRCSSIKLVNSVMTLKGNICEESVITQREVIESLFALLNETSFNRMTSAGAIATKDYIEIEVYNNGERIVSFRVIGGYVLEVGEIPMPHRYKSSERDLLANVRKVIGVRGSGTERVNVPTKKLFFEN